MSGLAGSALVIVSLVVGLQNTGVPVGANAEAPLPDRLAPSTWALALPTSWFDAPIPSVHAGDSVDLIAVRSGDRPFAIPIAADLLVMEVDDRAVVFEVDEDAATAIATARGSNLLLVPLLRSRR